MAATTRERVLAAVSELGYRPNNAARSLITNRTSTLGLLGFGVGLYAPAQIIDSIEREAKRLGYTLSMSSIKDFTPEAFERGIKELVSLPVDGLILYAPIIGLDMHRVRRSCSDIPFLLIDTHPNVGVPSVNIDQAKGAQLAAEHLLEKGHRAIAQLHGPLNGMDGKLRYDAFVKASSVRGATIVANQEGDWSSQGGYEAMKTILAAGDALSAVFVHNDQMALGAMRAIREAGLRIPEDVSVVGFDDIPEAAYFEPPLTTVKQDFAAIGQQCVDYLISLLGDTPPAPHQRVIAPVLVDRKSVSRK